MRSNERARVLLVDDARMERMLVEAKLEEHGYEVVATGSGVEALEVWEEARAGANGFDLIVLDVLMPELDGIAVLERLRKEQSPIELPVIIATGKDRSEDVVHALQAGANDFIAKPMDMGVLIARIETQLSLKRSHEALRDAQRAMIRAAKMESIGHLAAGVAHEIRNPLAEIQLAADGLKGNGVDESTSDFLIERITENVARADEIVVKLMRISSSKQLELSPGDVNQLVENALEWLDEELNQNGIVVERRLTEDLPEIPFARHEMRQVLVNVLLNAIQAMPGGGPLTVTTCEEQVDGLRHDEGSRTGNRLRNGDEAIKIQIEDEGPGIPQEALLDLFDAFFTSKATGKGMGLGLTVARKLVELHHGVISVTNRESGQGVRVGILLPKGGGLHTEV